MPIGRTIQPLQEEEGGFRLLRSDQVGKEACEEALFQGFPPSFQVRSVHEALQDALPPHVQVPVPLPSHEKDEEEDDLGGRRLPRG